VLLFFWKKFRNAESVPKIQSERCGIGYTNARKKRFPNAVPSCVLLKKNFRNSVPARYVTKNTPAHNHYKDEHVNAVFKNIHFMPINTLCGQNIEQLIVKAGGS
jgi:hypothetical protein